MPHSSKAAARHKELKFIFRRQAEDRMVAATLAWWSRYHAILGIDDARLLWANGSYLGRPKSFFVIKQLHELGYTPAAPRLTLAVPSEHGHALFLWFKHPESPVTPECESMRAALRSHDNAVAVVESAEAAIERIVNYLPAPFVPGDGPEIKWAINRPGAGIPEGLLAKRPVSAAKNE